MEDFRVVTGNLKGHRKERRAAAEAWPCYACRWTKSNSRAGTQGRKFIRETLRKDILTLQKQCAALQASIKNFKGERSLDT